jgi:hypothetical protein
MLIVIYVGVVDDSVDYIEEYDVKFLLKLLDTKEIIDYVRDVINLKPVCKIRHVAIEIDAKFGTFITQKKGMKRGLIKDDRIYDKIEQLFEELYTEK